MGIRYGETEGDICRQKRQRNAETQTKRERQICERQQVARERGNLGRGNTELERTRATKKTKHLRRFTRQTERKVQKGKYKREEEDIWELRS